MTKPPIICVLVFDSSNQLAVRISKSMTSLAFVDTETSSARVQLNENYPAHTEPVEYFSLEIGHITYQVHFSQVTDSSSRDTEIRFQSIETLQTGQNTLVDPMPTILERLEAHLIDIPYLHLGERDFINKFRPESQRNTSIYEQDLEVKELYQSQLCAAIKALARTHERAATSPLTLDFGPISYTIPSHFGFCLGVKNAIERAYETLAENPEKQVYMLSELIHNPFVNNDLITRGLQYLQTDKGTPYTIENKPASNENTIPLKWDTLTSDDIVIIPAFGATDEDKRKLVRKGIAVCQYDATCMLVEKVWKAARNYGRNGYTVIIHGKAEHEETKATFSNTRRYAPAIIVRDLEETQTLGRIITSDDPATRASFYQIFAGKHTPDFDVEKHFQRVAVVNQTTLLVNETRAIISYLRDIYIQQYGPQGDSQVGGSGRTDTLCYATQVNQDALAKALSQPLDAAFVIGGKNSSNTYQLYRLCEQTLGEHAHFIQSESNIISDVAVEHFVFPSASHGPPQGKTMTRELWSAGDQPKRVLITGGASCPDGIIQQVVTRLNSLFPSAALRPLEAILAELKSTS